MTAKRLGALLCLVVCFCALSAAFWFLRDEGARAATITRADDARPNVIVIMADDLGYADISTYGIDRIQTPRIDALAGSGVLFTHGYVTASVCAPSRAGMITGRYQQRFGFEFNQGEVPEGAQGAKAAAIDPGLAPDEITLAAALKKAGYRTGLIGKWHLGDSDKYYPTNRGFDEFYGFLTGNTAYIDPNHPDVIGAKVMLGNIDTDAASAAQKNKGSAVRGPKDEILRGPNRDVVRNYDKYLTEDFAEQASGFIVRNKEKPFFLYTAFNAPHTPYQVTRKYYDRFPHIKDEKLRVYAAMISALDDAVGRILDTLDEQGLAENTIVVFMSDNGCVNFKGVCVCEPLRGGKFTHFEGGVRVPFMMRWPAKLPKGEVYRRSVSALDIFPTAMKAAGGALPSDRIYDGVDLIPYLTGKKTGTAHPELMWMRRPHAAISDGAWKFMENGDTPYLFDLKKDPNEQTNLYDKRPDKVAQMKKKLDDWKAQMISPAWPSRVMPPLDVCGVEIELPV